MRMLKHMTHQRYQPVRVLPSAAAFLINAEKLLGGCEAK